MFERNRVDNSRDTKAAAAQIELTDGRRVGGKFRIARSKTLVEVLNGPEQFIEFEPFNGSAEVIAKSSIRSLRTISAPSGRDPGTILKHGDDFDPHAILGLAKGASRSEIRTAYHRHSKSYHPDRYSNTELPAEVATYLDAMARRINAAYEVLSDEAARAEAHAGHRTEPVYSSGPAA